MSTSRLTRTSTQSSLARGQWLLLALIAAAWVLLLTLLIFVEKVLPFGRRAAIVTGIAFVALGILVAAT